MGRLSATRTASESRALRPARPACWRWQVPSRSQSRSKNVDEEVTHEIRYSIWKSEHDDSVQNTNVDPELESIRRDDAEKTPRKSFMLDAPTVLLAFVS